MMQKGWLFLRSLSLTYLLYTASMCLHAGGVYPIVQGGLSYSARGSILPPLHRQCVPSLSGAHDAIP